MINRSGIEVAVDAEPEGQLSSGCRDHGAQRPVVRERIESLPKWPLTWPFIFCVQHIDAHVEVVGDIPLGGASRPTTFASCYCSLR